MKVSRHLLLLPLVFGIAACGGDADRDVIITDGETMTPGAETPTVGPAVQPEPAAPAEMATNAELEPLAGSGVGGEVTVRDRGAQSEVLVRLTGTPGNSTHPGHIHSGTCDAPGGVVQALQPITTDGTGAGTMTTTVDVPGMTVLNGQHIVVYHGAGGTPITCAELPQHTM